MIKNKENLTVNCKWDSWTCPAFHFSTDESSIEIETPSLLKNVARKKNLFRSFHVRDFMKSKIRGATKSYFKYYSCLVIILFNTGLFSNFLMENQLHCLHFLMENQFFASLLFLVSCMHWVEFYVIYITLFIYFLHHSHIHIMF